MSDSPELRPDMPSATEIRILLVDDVPQEPPVDGSMARQMHLTAAAFDTATTKARVLGAEVAGDLTEYVNAVSSDLEAYTYSAVMAGVSAAFNDDNLDRKNLFVKVLGDLGKLPVEVTHNLLASMIVDVMEEVMKEPTVEAQVRVWESTRRG